MTQTTAVRERPILFSAPMVRAILSGSKTQTRRMRRLDEVNATAQHWTLNNVGPLNVYAKPKYRGRFGAYFHSETITPGSIRICPVVCPFGQPGDRLWVRERLEWHLGDDDENTWVYAAGGDEVKVAPDNDAAVEWLCKQPFTRKTISPIHTPRWASRITLEVTGVRVERVQDISEADAEAEGVSRDGPVGYIPAALAQPYVYQYARLWDEIHGDGAWKSNPFVWVIEFKRVTPD